MKKALLSVAILSVAAGASFAQDNLLANKPIYTLGEALTWTADDASYTFVTDDLAKIVATPENTSNVYLYPENGTLNTTENQEKGAQVFYVDMQAVYSVGRVVTTWEGAAADSYNIYLTNDVPTLDILSTTPTYTVSGLGQYSSHTALLDDGSKGRYLVFQVTKATNWGWGVKIRSMSAYEPTSDILTTFSVSPAIVALNAPTGVTFSCLNQFGSSIDNAEVTFAVSDNATLEGTTLTAASGEKVTVSATYGDVTLTSDVYIATVAPTAPAASAIKTPVFTNTVTDYNDYISYTVAYNGGAVNYGKVEYEDGSVAWAFGNTRCVFFNNTQTTGVWDADIDPTELGYATLHIDIFGTKDVSGNVEFERTTTIGNQHPFTLEAGKWTSVDVDLRGETVLHTMSVRFSADDMCDILLANIYFTAAYVDGDETAPELGDVTATTVGCTGAILSFSATDDMSETINYTISDGTNSYTTTADSGVEVNYTVKGLRPETAYNFTVTASDGKNVSAAKNITVTTKNFPDTPELSYHKDSVVAVFSPAYDVHDIPTFSNWNSSADYYHATTQSGHNVLVLTNYHGQYGGITGFNTRVTNMTHLHIDIHGDIEEGMLTIAPVWQGVDNTPGKEVIVYPNQWNSYDIPLSELGKDVQVNNVVYQLSMNNSTVNDFAVSNFLFYDEQNTAKIETVETVEPAAEVIYDLQGRRVMNPGHGLYIINGKKVLK